MVAFNVFFKVVENDKEFQTKGMPWLCDKCRREDEVLLKITVDYNNIVLCKKCLMESKRLITNKEKELKDVGRSNK